MRKLIRVHHTGTRATIREYSKGAWHINLDVREPNRLAQTIVGYLSPTQDNAKEHAGSEVLKYGHVCSVSWSGWEASSK
jgi:hypothetical protein